MGNRPRTGPLLAAARCFVRDFTRYAGRRGVVAAMFVLLAACLEGLGLALLVPLLAVVFGAAPPGLQAYADALFGLVGANDTLGRLIVLFSGFGIVMVARGVALSIRGVMLAELQVGFMEEQRMKIVARLANAGWSKVAHLRHARITHLMSGDIQRVGSAAHFVLQGFSASIMLLAQSVLALLLAPVLALIAFCTLAAGAAVVVPLARKAHVLGDYQTRANLSLLDTATQLLGGLKLAVSQGEQRFFVAEFRATLHALTKRQVDAFRQQTRGQVLSTSMSALVAAALVLAGVGIMHTAPAVLTTLLVVVVRMSGPASQIQQGIQQLAQTLPAYGQIKALEAELVPDGAFDDATPIAPEGAIVFEDVSFLHDDGTRDRGVRHVSLTVMPGAFIGVTGPSGAGKTTFADLLVGLYPPQSGAIRVGGVPLRGSALAGWRDALSYVSQDPFLFHDTIRRNLAWRPVSESEMWCMLRLTGADDVVRRMPDGLDTVVGERGMLVSGGERQRIALARALLRKPRLLVLDEATSAIDVPGERAIIENLLTLAPRPTIVMIAHRPDSVQMCTRLLHFEDGRVRNTTDGI